MGRFLTYPTGDARSIASSGSGIAAKPLPKRLQKGDSRSCDGRDIALSDPAEACDRASVHTVGLGVFGSAVRKPGAPSEGRYGQPGLSLRTGANRSLLSKATSVHDRVEWGRHAAQTKRIVLIPYMTSQSLGARGEHQVESALAAPRTGSPGKATGVSEGAVIGALWQPSSVPASVVICIRRCSEKAS